MSRQLEYTFKGETKIITFSYRKYHSPHEAVAFAENIDISNFLKMERHLEVIADGKAVKNHREAFFHSLGFGRIYLMKKEAKSIKEKSTKSES